MKKMLLALLMCTGLMLIVLPQTVQAADDYVYIDKNGETKTTEGLTVTPITVDTATLTDGWYVVNNDVPHNGTITVSGDVHLIIMDGFTLSVTGSPDNAGIRVSPGNSLSVYGQAEGTGTLNAQGGINGAGIGGGKNSSSGTITINSGTVTAIGGNYGAGIGGGYYGNGGTINLAGGTVNATGGNAGLVVEGTSLHSGAGIGGGYNGSGGTITISGGTVTAISGYADTSAGAGIGGGSGKDGGRITISGGNVTTNSAKDGAGLGGGAYGAGGVILISGGDVTARSTYRGAGIGGGLIYADGGSITISGGTVKAYGGDQGGSGIGGASYSAGGTIKIQGGVVEATGGLWGAGIGGGYGGNGGAITISSGTIKAYAGSYGAGIGAGGTNTAGSHNGGTIKILGGKVTARGGASGMDAGLDIGRGRNGVNGTLLIDDTAQVTLAANGIDSSATTLETCILQGSASGSLLGAYEDGTKIDGTLIDISNSALSSGTGYTVSDNTVTLSGSGNSYVLFGSTTSRNIVVSSGSSANVALFAADIRPESGCSFNMTGATVNLRLVETNTLTSTSGFAGLQAPAGSVLTINGSATATLTTQGSADAAGIGGSSNNSGGTITINSGTVIATGGSRGAGIGGGYYYSTGGTITINGGTVKARGGSGAAGIGGGDRGSGGNITINGGTVEAWGGAASVSSGAGIGGGVFGNGGTITIMSGTVIAHGGGDGAGIGGGSSSSSGNINISGGNVNAYGGSYGAGIGGGWAGSAVNIFISGGTVMAQGGSNGSGIGGGGRGGTGGSVAISGGTITAYGGSAGYSGGGGAGVGGGGGTGSIGNGSASGTVTISGSATVTARGSDGGAGIGGGGTSGGVGGAGGTVLADGANVTVSATGSGNGYDIGSGNSNTTGGSLSIENNATVNLNRNGTNANDNFVTGTIGGDGAGFLAGTYLNSQKLLTCSNVTASPSSGAKAFDSVTLTASITGLFIPDPQGQIAFFNDGAKIGQVSLTRIADGSAEATADFMWSSRGGSHTLTAQYVQNETLDSYYMTNAGELEDYEVAKTEQASLSIGGIPDTVTYGDTSFSLSFSGGSGTGGYSYEVTGDAVSVSASGVVTVEKSGQATITVTKAGDGNYLSVSADVIITVNKAIPAAVVFPSAAGLTYGQPLSDSALTGGSVEGTFAWEEPDTIPTVINSGYNVTFMPNDTDNYDYTGFVLTQNVGIHVNKAMPVVTFPTADEITYEQPLSDSELTGGSGDGSFAWESPATIPTVVNSGYRVIFTPDDTDNYLTASQIVAITVKKAQQETLNIGGVPSTVTYGDSPFDLSGSGGSGTGTFSYSVASGDAVSVSASGVVTVEKAGNATITITKAGDSNYLSVSDDVTITVNKAIPLAVVFPSAAELTYGQPLSDSALTGGSVEGTFAWEEPDTIPTVINSGYNVTFMPNDTDNYDYTGFVLTQNVGIHVNKAMPVVTFPTADEITYEQPLSDSELTGGSGDGSFTWASPNTIPTVVNSGYSVIFTPDDTVNYLTTSQIVAITVQKAQQASINVGGIPGTVTYGDSPFDLLGSGGSGTGDFNYLVASDDVVSVNTSGTVTVHTAGTAQITATKEGDDNYLPVSVDVTITVNKAIPIAVFPIAASLTYGQPLSDSALTGGSGVGSFVWESADTIPTVINNGYNVTFTPSDTDNYLTIKKSVAIAVRKAAQAPLSVSGIPDIITFGEKPFELRVSGGSGTGSLSYAVISGNAVTVGALGKVTITHGGTSTIKITNPGDDNYLPVSRTVSLTVDKAKQVAALSFALPESIAYGDTPFQIIGSGGNGSGAFSYQGASSEAVIVSTTGKVTILRPGEAIITAVKVGDIDYLSQEKKIHVSVGKGTQNALVITGVPSRPTYGNAPFHLTVGGGNGTGVLSYAVTSGNVVSVDASGTVTILRPGRAVLTVSKAGDDYYHATSATVEIYVRRAASVEEIEGTSSAPPTPSATPFYTVAPSPTATVMPNPTATDASPSPAESPARVTLKPLYIQRDETTGMLVATISMDNLPEGAVAIQLLSGQLIQIDTTQTTLQLQISQADLNKNGQLEIIVLDAENIPMGNYLIDFAQEAWLQDTTENGAAPISVLLWIAAGVLFVGMVTAATVVWHKKRK